MLTYAEARNALRRTGVARAQGDALAASYAPLVAQRNALSKRSEEKIYRHLAAASDLLSETKRLLTDPFAAVTIAVS
jgi:hypothetical protein